MMKLNLHQYKSIKY